MKLSEVFDITVDDKLEWFDPFLSLDTKLFIDPFLIYSAEEGYFIGSHKEIIDFFNDAFSFIAKSGGNRDSIYWKRAEALLVFPEAEELCIGYSGSSTKGSGSGKGFAKIIADALWEAVCAGKENLNHFEEVGILREGIGADRISDITATLLRHRLITYTQNVCHTFNVPTKRVRFRQGSYNKEFNRWVPHTTDLPINPYNDKPILLVPQKYIRELPTITADDFWDYCYVNENEVLRIEFGQDITSKVDKETIINFARKHPEVRQRYIQEVESGEPTPYDFVADRKGYIRWHEAAQEYCLKVPLEIRVGSSEEFFDAVIEMVDEFVNYVENNRGWRLLWNDRGTAKSEEAAQLLFLGIIKHYCKANNIDISREANIGRGPVDFKVSKGYSLRALLELKLAKNTKFWNGLTKQLPKYLESEGVNTGFFIVVVYSDNDLARVKEIELRVEEVRRNTGKRILVKIVDASRNHPSASLL